MKQSIDTLVIGGGQVGLTTSHYLKRLGRDHVVLDAGTAVGDSWRRRWDSLVLFTPKRYSSLPGKRFPGRASEFPTKEEMADYLGAYAKKQGIDVQLGTRVEKIREKNGSFQVATSQGEWTARNIIIAMSDYRLPKRPAFASAIDETVLQIHSSEFVNPKQLNDGPVLIVGLGNSGADICMEVAKSHETIISGEPSSVVPFRIEPWIARNVLVRLVRFVGHNVLNLGTPIGKKVVPRLRMQGGPLVRVKPKDLTDSGARRVGRIVRVEGGIPVTAEGELLTVKNIIWCTGFRPDWSWLELPVKDELGRPVERRGVIEGTAGLYCVGGEFQYAGTSATVTGHPRDVRYVVKHLRKYRPA